MKKIILYVFGVVLLILIITNPSLKDLGKIRAMRPIWDYPENTISFFGASMFHPVTIQKAQHITVNI